MQRANQQQNEHKQCDILVLNQKLNQLYYTKLHGRQKHEKRKKTGDYSHGLLTIQKA